MTACRFLHDTVSQHVVLTWYSIPICHVEYSIPTCRCTWCTIPTCRFTWYNNPTCHIDVIQYSNMSYWRDTVSSMSFLSRYSIPNMSYWSDTVSQHVILKWYSIPTCHIEVIQYPNMSYWSDTVSNMSYWRDTVTQHVILKWYSYPACHIEVVQYPACHIDVIQYSSLSYWRDTVTQHVILSRYSTPLCRVWSTYMSTTFNAMSTCQFYLHNHTVWTSCNSGYCVIIACMPWSDYADARRIWGYADRMSMV